MNAGRKVSLMQGLAMCPVDAVVPDLERWGDSYVRMAFEGEPTADCERTSLISPESLRRISGTLYIVYSGHVNLGTVPPSAKV
jgi:hypothetical protein